MVLTLRIFLLVCVLLYMVVIVWLLKKRKLHLRFSLLWLFAGFCLLLACCFPSAIQWAARAIGMVDGVNLVFVLEGLFVLCILLSLTTILSAQHNRIRRMTQQLSLLEQRLRMLEEQKKDAGDDRHKET